MENNLQKIAEKLKIGLSTLYQWRTTRPELYSFLVENSATQKSEIDSLFELLDESEREMYLSEIRARVLRKKDQGKA